MPSYAPLCRIRQVFGADPLTATELLLDAGLGDAFTATPPFDVLIWPTQELPIYDANARQTRNAELVTVTEREDDRVVITRSANPILVIAGLMFGMVAAQPVVSFGEIVHLVDTISSGEAPYTLRLARPDGTTDDVLGLTSPEWAGTAGSAQIPASGQYHYVFSDAVGKRSPNQDFFVSFGV